MKVSTLFDAGERAARTFFATLGTGSLANFTNYGEK